MCLVMSLMHYIIGLLAFGDVLHTLGTVPHVLVMSLMHFIIGLLAFGDVLHALGNVPHETGNGS